MNDPLGLFDEGAGNDPLGLFTEPKQKTSLGEDFKIGLSNVGNTVDRGWSGLALALANLMGDEKGAEDIYKELQARIQSRNQFADVGGKEQGISGKVASVITTLPSQVLSMPLSSFDTGQTMIEQGETLPRALAGTGVDTIGNMVGVALPGSKGLTIPGKAVSGGLINAAQDTATRAAIAALAEKESTKELLGPSWENAAVAGVVGAGVGALHGPGKARPVDADPLGLFKEPEAPQRPLVNQTEMEMPTNHFIPDSRKLSVDENGMPIDFAKSMDVQESGRKGQPDLFDEEWRARGEEMRARELAKQQRQEAAIEVPQENPAIKQQQIEEAYAQRQQGLFEEQQRVKQEAQDDVLSKLEEDLREKAYKPQGNGQGPKTRSFNRARKGQGGGIDVQAIKESIDSLTEKLKKITESGLYKNLSFVQKMDLELPLVRERNALYEKLNAHYDEERATRQAAQLKPFQDLSKQLSDFKAEDRRSKFEVIRSPNNKQKGGVDIESIGDGFRALLNGKEVGRLKSNLTPEQSKAIQENANIDIVTVAPEHRGTGVGKALYDAWNQAHEGRIAPSGKTTQAAWNVWKRNFPEKVDQFVAQEAARLRDGAPKDVVIGNITDPHIANRVLYESQKPGAYVPRSERGGIDFQGIGEGLQKLIPSLVEAPTPLKDIVGKNAIPADPKPADVVARALKEGKDADVWNITKYTESGGTLAAMSRKSALVKGVSEIVQNAQKKADLYTRKTVVPVEQQFRRMGMKEIESLAQVMKEEMFNEKLYTAEQLEARGLSDKQLSTYAGMRQMFEDSLELQNKARAEQGLKPITKVEHYISSRWTGDFRQPIRDAEGKLVWYLAADTRGALNKQVKTLLEQFPGYKTDAKEGHIVKAGRMRNDLQGMYTTMVDILGRDDPAVQRIKDAYEASIAADSFKAMGQKKHFEHKGNIRGFIGDRPGANPRKEALAMFQEQVQYAKNAYKWAALQEAGTKVKAILSDEQLATQQPKNVEYAQEYFKDNLGQGTAKWVDGIENAFRDAGISPAVVDKYVGSVKSFFITQKLAVSLGYTAANVLQIMNTVPHLVDVMVKEGGNPVKALASGILAGTGMTSGHYLNKLGGDFESLTKELPFLTEAFKYAEDNGITSRSIYDESPINQRGVINKSLEIAGKTLSIPETWVRSMAYMSFVQMLKDTKAYKDNTKLFQRAEELTNAAMVDYRAGERPIGFSKLGIAGNALNTLQTFPANLYNQYRYFAKEAIRGNPVPLLTMLSLQVAMAGAMGLPGFNDLDKLWGWAKEHMPDAAWAKVKDFDPKLAILENFGEAALYGAVSTGSGVSMTSRLSAPGGFDMLQAPGGPIVDLAKQAGSVANAVMDPNETTLAQAARNITLTGLQGYMETGPLKDQFAVNKRPDGRTMYKKATDLADRAGQYARTPEEETIRKLGLRSQRETLHNEVNYKIGQIEKQTNERSKGMVEKYYDAVRRGDTKKATDIQKLYTSLNGKAINDEQFNNQLMEEYTTTFERKSATAKEKIEALKGMARIRKIMENQ